MDRETLLPVEIVEHTAFVRRLAFHLLRDEADAEDAAQQTILRALEHPPRSGPRVRAWLAAVLRNVVRKGHRSSTRRARREQEAARAEAVASSQSVAARKEILEVVTRAIRRLDPVSLEVVLLRHYEDLAPREIGARLGISVDTVNGRLKRAHAKLRACLDEESGGNVEGWRLALGALVGGGPELGLDRGQVPVGGGIAMAIGTKAGLAVAVALLVGALLAALWARGSTRDEPRELALQSPGGAEVPGAGTAPGLAARAAASDMHSQDANPQSLDAPEPASVAGPRVAGRIEDATGRAIPGVRVIAFAGTAASLGVDALGKPDAPAFRATTGPDGRFQVRVSKAAPVHTIVASHDDAGYAVRLGVVPGSDFVLRLEPARALEGTVESQDGRPIGGATVRFLGLVDAWQLVREVRTGPDGAFRIVGLPGGDWSGKWRGYFFAAWLEAGAEAYATRLLPLVGFGGPRTSDGTRPMRVVLDAGSTVTGRVVDGETEAPIAGAQVRLYTDEAGAGMQREDGTSFLSPYSPRPLGETRSGADGAFSFAHVPLPRPGFAPPSGQSRLSVAAWSVGRSAATWRLQVGAGPEPAPVTLQLWASATVVGRVLEPDGAPAAGVRVYASVRGRERALAPAIYADAPSPDRTTGPDGRFRLDGVPVGGGEPAPVEVKGWQQDASGSRRSADEGGECSASGTARAGETLDVGDLKLRGPDPSACTYVVVRARSGDPVWGARVRDIGPSMRQHRTDATGRTTIPWGPPPQDGVRRPWRACVEAVGFALTPVTLQPPEAGPEVTEVVLDPEHRVEGRLVRADGTPVAGEYVQVGDGSLPLKGVFPESSGPGLAPDDRRPPPDRALPIVYGGTITDAGGAFSVGSLPPGPYHVLAQVARPPVAGANPPPARAVRSDVSSDARDVELRLSAEEAVELGSLIGRVSDAATGARPAGLRVILFRDGRFAAEASNPGRGPVPLPPSSGGPLGEDGAFAFPELAAGSYEVRLVATGYVEQRVAGVVVRSGETTSLPAVRMSVGTTVTGRLRFPSDLSPAGRHVTFVRRADGDPVVAISAELAADGGYRASGFLPGAYSVEAWSPAPPGPTTPPPLTLPLAIELRVPTEAREVRFDAELVAAGTLALQPEDPRLPPAPWSGGRASAEQAAFGAAARVRVTAADGREVLNALGVSRYEVSGHRSNLALPPGRYVARIEMPGDEVREEAVDLTAGATVFIRFAKR